MNGSYCKIRCESVLDPVLHHGREILIPQSTLHSYGPTWSIKRREGKRVQLSAIRRRNKRLDYRKRQKRSAGYRREAEFRQWRPVLFLQASLSTTPATIRLIVHEAMVITMPRSRSISESVLSPVSHPRTNPASSTKFLTTLKVVALLPFCALLTSYSL